MCDGLSERINETLIKMIKCNINDEHNDWDELLPALAYAYNTSVHASTGVTPFFAMFGRHPKCPEDLIIKRPDIDFPVSTGSYAEHIKGNIQKAFEVIKTNGDRKTELAKIYNNRNHIASTFNVGESVWVRYYKTPPGACKKFTNKWKGPYSIEARLEELV